MSKKEYCKQKIYKILNALAEYKQDDWAWCQKDYLPSIKRFSMMLGITEKTCSNYIKEMKEEGLIQDFYQDDGSKDGYWIKTNGYNFDLNPKNVDMLIFACSDIVFNTYLELWKKWENKDYELKENEFNKNVLLCLYHGKMIDYNNNQLIWIR